MSSAGEVAAGATVEGVIAALALGFLFRVYGQFFPVPRRLVVLPFQTGVVLHGSLPERVVGPGSYWLLPSRTILTCDTRPVSFELRSQELLTSDNMGLRVSLTGQYRITDPMAFLTSSTNATRAFFLELKQALRTAIAELSGHTYLPAREALPARIQHLVAPRAAHIGITVDLLEVSEYVPLGWLKAAMPQPGIVPQTGFGPN